MLQTITAKNGRSVLITNPELLYYVVTSMFYISKLTPLQFILHIIVLKL